MSLLHECEENETGRGPDGRAGARASRHTTRVESESGDDGEHVAGAEDEVLLAGVLDLGAAVLAVDDLVADADVERDAVAVVVDRPGPTAMTSPSWGFSLAVSGMTRPEAVVCSASRVLTRIRSSRGLMLTDTLSTSTF